MTEIAFRPRTEHLPTRCAISVGIHNIPCPQMPTYTYRSHVFCAAHAPRNARRIRPETWRERGERALAYVGSLIVTAGMAFVVTAIVIAFYELVNSPLWHVLMDMLEGLIRSALRAQP